MIDKPPYRKWVGVLLGYLLHGSAHFLSGQCGTGLRWFFGLLGCGFLGGALLATPGAIPLACGVITYLAVFVLWVVMLKQSYRPVRRIGVWGWIVVAVLAVAVGYVEQLVAEQVVRPFRLPTGAMQPTLRGHGCYPLSADSRERPRPFARLLRGERFHEVKALSSGELSYPYMSGSSTSEVFLNVGNRRHTVPRSASLLKRPGDHVVKGETIWSGVLTAGDWLLAERVSYRFRDPRRGEIAVFRTDGIDTLPPGTFYIMRIVGLPGETIRIDPPFLLVNDEKVVEPPIFEKISSGSDGYAGYQRVSPFQPGLRRPPANEFVLGEDEYFVLGDNTRNSRDSRYWGAVPRKNIIGRATRVYWPFSRMGALDGRE